MVYSQDQCANKLLLSAWHMIIKHGMFSLHKYDVTSSQTLFSDFTQQQFRNRLPVHVFLLNLIYNGFTHKIQCFSNKHDSSGFYSKQYCWKMLMFSAQNTHAVYLLFAFIYTACALWVQKFFCWNILVWCGCFSLNRAPHLRNLF